MIAARYTHRNTPAASSTRNLSLTASPVHHTLLPTQSGKKTLDSDYDYVMYGKVFKKEDENAGGIQKTTVIASFGGLLMRIKADPKNLQEVDIDNRVYVLIRKIA